MDLVPARTVRGPCVPGVLKVQATGQRDEGRRDARAPRSPLARPPVRRWRAPEELLVLGASGQRPR